MKLTVDFSDLRNAVQRMRAETVDFSVHVELRPLDPIDTELEQGIELPSLDDVERSKGLLSYKGRQILLYIRDHKENVQETLANGQKGNKFHVADCLTLQQMRTAGRFERYVVTNNLDGWFEIEGINGQTCQQEKGAARLWVCQNCLKQLNYKGAQHADRRALARDFDIGEFFATYSSFFPHPPRRRADDGGGEGYSDDWPQVAGHYKADKGFCCEQCGVDLTAHKNLLHGHHCNGVKSDNSLSNLLALCASCHREQPAHGHMFVSHEDTRTINRLRREQGLLEKGGWDDAYRFCDPALHGVLDACRRSGCPMPEIGFDVQDKNHQAVIASLEIAWPVQRVGIAISEEDGKAAALAGWKVKDVVDILDNPTRLCERL